MTVATEPVVPLSVHLESLDEDGVRGEARDAYVAWGILQVSSWGLSVSFEWVSGLTLEF